MKAVANHKLEQLRTLLMRSERMTCPAAADRLGWFKTTCSSAMAFLYEKGEVHIVDYERRGTNLAAVYAFGPGEDAVRPKPLDRYEAKRIREARED